MSQQRQAPRDSRLMSIEYLCVSPVTETADTAPCAVDPDSRAPAKLLPSRDEKKIKDLPIVQPHERASEKSYNKDREVDRPPAMTKPRLSSQTPTFSDEKLLGVFVSNDIQAARQAQTRAPLGGQGRGHQPAVDQKRRQKALDPHKKRQNIYQNARDSLKQQRKVEELRLAGINTNPHGGTAEPRLCDFSLTDPPSIPTGGTREPLLGFQAIPPQQATQSSQTCALEFDKNAQENFEARIRYPVNEQPEDEKDVQAGQFGSLRPIPATKTPADIQERNRGDPKATSMPSSNHQGDTRLTSRETVEAAGLPSKSTAEGLMISTMRQCDHAQTLNLEDRQIPSRTNMALADGEALCHDENSVKNGIPDPLNPTSSKMKEAGTTIDKIREDGLCLDRQPSNTCAMNNITFTQPGGHEKMFLIADKTDRPENQHSVEATSNIGHESQLPVNAACESESISRELSLDAGHLMSNPFGNGSDRTGKDNNPGSIAVGPMIQEQDEKKHEPGEAHGPIDVATTEAINPERRPCLSPSNSNDATDQNFASARPFACTICPRSYKRSDHLKRHQCTHTQPFECAECPERFSRREDLMKHRQKLHKSISLSEDVEPEPFQGYKTVEKKRLAEQGTSDYEKKSAKRQRVNTQAWHQPSATANGSQQQVVWEPTKQHQTRSQTRRMASIMHL